jgi:hypothetical protein
MWTVVTTVGGRIDGIAHEHIALKTVHSMGTTTLIGPYRYAVIDNRGHRFSAEIRRSCTPASRRSPISRERYG